MISEKNVIPAMTPQDRVYAYSFRDENKKTAKYWRDIGTLEAYYEASMDLVAVSPIFNLYDSGWPIRTYQHQRPPAKTVFRDSHRQGEVLDSLVSSGCIISGAHVEQSVLGPSVFVHSWAHLEGCVVFEDVEIGRHAKIRRAIIDKEVKIPKGERIGFDLDLTLASISRPIIAAPMEHIAAHYSSANGGLHSFSLGRLMSIRLFGGEWEEVLELGGRWLPAVFAQLEGLGAADFLALLVAVGFD
jgi:ADP-glucose pyrophosphorylase